MSKRKLPNRNVFYVGMMSFFGGISQDMFAPILPLYLANVLHLNKEFIGLSAGLVTSAVSIFRVLAGFIADKLGRTKPIIFAGYFLSLISRPLLAFVPSNIGILLLRGLDGTGKGVKEAPKDKLVANSSLDSQRGMAFGIARALDTLGSVAGPLLLFGLLSVLAENADKYQFIFVISALPLVVTLLILVFKVKEPQLLALPAKHNGGKLPPKFYVFLGIVLLFSLGNSADAFLILRAQNLGVTLLVIPLIYALFNFVYASASIPLGGLSDRIGREKVILMGWVAFVISYLGFAAATESWQAWILFALYGVYFATTEGVTKAMIADLVPADHRGRAYGIYSGLVGVVALPASLLAGYLWDNFSPAAPFLIGAVITAAAAGGLWIFVRYNRE